MKTILKIGILASLSLLFSSCEDIFEVDYPELSISFDDTSRVDLEGTMQAYTGDQIYINISGDMDILYQYDGTPGYEYLTDEEQDLTGGTAKFQFRSSLRHLVAERQDDCLTFLMSTDFTGVKDSINILNATWIEISADDHGGFDDVGSSDNPAVGTFYTEAESDFVNIYDHLPGEIEDYDYVYFAFRYKTQTVGNAGKYGPSWYVRYFDFRRVYGNGRYQYYGLYDPNVSANDMTEHFVYAGFFDGTDWTPEGSAVDVDGVNKWTVTNRINNAGQCDYGAISPNMGDAYTDLCDDDWLISHMFDLKQAPADDYAVPLKGTTTDVPEYTTVTYDTPGTYTVTIVAKNLTIKDEKIVVRRLQVNITDAGE